MRRAEAGSDGVRVFDDSCFWSKPISPLILRYFLVLVPDCLLDLNVGSWLLFYALVKVV